MQPAYAPEFRPVPEVPDIDSPRYTVGFEELESEGPTFDPEYSQFEQGFDGLDSANPETEQGNTVELQYVIEGGRAFSLDENGEPIPEFELILNAEQQVEFNKVLNLQESQTIEVKTDFGDADNECWSIQTYTPAGFDSKGRQLVTLVATSELRPIKEEEPEEQDTEVELDQSGGLIVSPEIPNDTDPFDGSGSDLEIALPEMNTAKAETTYQADFEADTEEDIEVPQVMADTSDTGEHYAVPLFEIDETEESSDASSNETITTAIEEPEIVAELAGTSTNNAEVTDSETVITENRVELAQQTAEVAPEATVEPIDEPTVTTEAFTDTAGEVATIEVFSVIDIETAEAVDSEETTITTEETASLTATETEHVDVTQDIPEKTEVTEPATTTKEEPVVLKVTTEQQQEDAQTEVASTIAEVTNKEPTTAPSPEKTQEATSPTPTQKTEATTTEIPVAEVIVAPIAMKQTETPAPITATTEVPKKEVSVPIRKKAETQRPILKETSAVPPSIKKGPEITPEKPTDVAVLKKEAAPQKIEATEEIHVEETEQTSAPSFTAEIYNNGEEQRYTVEYNYPYSPTKAAETTQKTEKQHNTPLTQTFDHLASPHQQTSVSTSTAAYDTTHPSDLVVSFTTGSNRRRNHLKLEMAASV